MEEKKEKLYQASFMVESVFLVSFFCIVICCFLVCVMVQYDFVVLQSNKIYMQYEQMNETKMEEIADRGCIVFHAKHCEQKKGITKTEFKLFLDVKSRPFLNMIQSTEVKMSGGWERMPVTEEIRLASVCIELLQ